MCCGASGSTLQRLWNSRAATDLFFSVFNDLKFSLVALRRYSTTVDSG